MEVDIQKGRLKRVYLKIGHNLVICIQERMSIIDIRRSNDDDELRSVMMEMPKGDSNPYI